MVNKMIPEKVPQLIQHSVSGLYITPMFRKNEDVELRLWRYGAASEEEENVQWVFEPVNGQDRVVQIRNRKYDRYITLSKPSANTAVTYTHPSGAGAPAQCWRLISPDTAQADFVIASMLDNQLVICPKEGRQEGETTLEVEQFGPWTDQFWRWRTPRGKK
ncbi:hypothetical protein ADK65_25695 [Streptomyces sp. NRRL B-1140]|uniref:RICIN domain-containing protein n=1 Tax=Streptomyces sp. NRRL B-1140 TaxID=1415549 RepID=UPI0006B00C9C|nr:RICIN domain-containing protein [Streptomyces sp. NRRL B-1140]KOV97433.1 hypothetical protein ADK65_25695 [Streptomyces sp. NRRL B-1140]